jgi:hypothetical protein
MLSKSSVLHYWSARYGINPRIGGRPVFTRNSAGVFTTQESEVDTAIINTPRFDWATLNLPNALTERRKVLTLEMARSNVAGFSEKFDNAAWAKTTSGAGSLPVVTADAAIAPDGTLTADKVVFAAPGGTDNSFLSESPTVVNATSYAGAFYVKAFAAVDVGKSILFRQVGGAVYGVVVLTADWQRFSRIETSVSTVGNFEIGLRPSVAGSAGTVTVLLWGADLEPGTFSTAYKTTPTSAAASRAVESCYWNHSPIPQALMGYVRFVEQGSIIGVGNPRIIHIGNAADAAARFTVYAGGAVYNVQHQPGGVVACVGVGTPAIGDTVELVPILFVDGSVQLIQSINGAAVTSSVRSAGVALASAWSDTRLWANSVGAVDVGANKFAEVKLVKFADVVAVTNQGWMDELRAFELGPNGDVL